MFRTEHRNRTASATAVLALVVGIATLTACQTPPDRGDVPDPQSGPAVEGERTAQSREYAGLPADRIAEAHDRRAAEHRALAERFAGVPADRIEEQLARERDE